MTGLPEGIYHAGLAALVKRFGHTPDSMEQVMIVADAVLPLIAAGERERITGLFGEWIEFCLGEIDGPHHPADAWRAGFASLVDPDHPGKIAEPTP
jgi:hypothetical protein